MNRRDFLTAATFTALAGGNASAEDRAAHWIEQAERLKPRLRESTKTPRAILRPVADVGTFLRWRFDTESPARSLEERHLRGRDSFILDFGEHMTGKLRFSVTPADGSVDAPTRLKLTFGEVPAEVAEPLDPYPGSLSRAWLQDEVINIDVLPATIELPRRYAFRYLKIDVIDTSSYRIHISGVQATALTSAGENPPALPESVSPLLRRIDAVSLATLRDCMQTVFEDGPKRDRRLWIGDLRLQALTNYVTFRNFDLVKRCLLLFAGLVREDGMIAACVYETPQPLRGGSYIVDYSALYAATVVEYARAANDWETARELWPVVRRQMEILDGYVGAGDIFAAPPKSWVFIDWNEQLDRIAAMHAIYVFGLQQARELALQAGARDEASRYEQRAAALTASGRAKFYDPARRVFVGGPGRQVSYATQAWMALSGIASRAEGADALRAVATMPGAVRPRSPYLCHYVVDAMLTCGMRTEARALIESYWGGMVNAGADTFWEVYDPANPRLSPYGSDLVNSYCHAWSCTPAYFLRGRDIA